MQMIRLTKGSTTKGSKRKWEETNKYEFTKTEYIIVSMEHPKMRTTNKKKNQKFKQVKK